MFLRKYVRKLYLSLFHIKTQKKFHELHILPDCPKITLPFCARLCAFDQQVLKSLFSFSWCLEVTGCWRKASQGKKRRHLKSVMVCTERKSKIYSLKKKMQLYELLLNLSIETLILTQLIRRIITTCRIFLVWVC